MKTTSYICAPRMNSGQALHVFTPNSIIYHPSPLKLTIQRPEI